MNITLMIPIHLMIGCGKRLIFMVEKQLLNLKDVFFLFPDYNSLYYMVDNLAMFAIPKMKSKYYKKCVFLWFMHTHYKLKKYQYV